VRELELLRELFVKDLLHDAKLPKPTVSILQNLQNLHIGGVLTGRPKPWQLLPTSRDVPVLLGCIENLYTLNLNLLRELEEANDAQPEVLGILQRYASLFKVRPHIDPLLVVG
jgi:hypothetical protein